MTSHYFGLTDPGRVRDNNEDTFLVEAMEAERVLAAVVDGVGGYEGGEIAAAIARDCIAELLTKPVDGDITEVLKETLIEANRRIVEAKASDRERERMACVLTLVLADTAQNQFYYAHVGDTRLYLLRGQSLVKVSKDHSFVGFLEESNRITEQNAMRHPKRNEISKALGFNMNIVAQKDYFDLGTSPFLPGDLLLLCSDGLTDMIGSREITAILTSDKGIPQKAQALIEAANDAGGRDNVTVVLVQNPKAPKSYEPGLTAKKKATQTHTNASKNKSVKSNRVAVWLLSALCIALGIVCVWLYTQRGRNQTSTAPPPTIPLATAHSAAEQQLLDSLSASGDSLVLDTMRFKSPLLISDTIQLNKDTFYLSGNGIVLRGDSTLRGPGFFLTSQAKYIVLENLVFENFSTAIVANNALQLRNVRFRNCDVAVSYAISFPEMQPVRGYISDRLFFETDSISNNQ